MPENKVVTQLMGNPEGTLSVASHIPSNPDSWFEITARENFERALLPSSNHPNLRYLQIGVFTGDASVWLMENVLTSPSSRLYDVDTWDGGNSPELEDVDFSEVRRIYNERIKPWTYPSANAGPYVFPFAMSSFTFLSIYNDAPFDFIYIDGDHSTISCLEDFVLAYRHLKPMGMVCFDDYTWESKHGALMEPTMAIDFIKVMYADRMRVLRVGSQCWMQRIDAEVRR